MRGVGANILVGAIVTTVVALLSVGAYVWLFIEVRTLVADVAVAAEEANVLSAQNKNTQTIRRVVRDTKNERAELQTYFVSEEELVAFLEELEVISTHTGSVITVQSVSAQKAIDKDDLLVPLALSLRASGTFTQVVHTLALIETFPKVLNLERVSFTQSANDGLWRGSYEVVLFQGSKPGEE